jgi:hypothetical protein
MNSPTVHTAALSVVGLLLNLVGFAIIAVAQNGLFAEISLWLNALDFTIETALHPTSDVYRFAGQDKRMKEKIGRSKRTSILGWLLVVAGVVLQLASALWK